MSAVLYRESGEDEMPKFVHTARPDVFVNGYGRVNAKIVVCLILGKRTPNFYDGDDGGTVTLPYLVA